MTDNEIIKALECCVNNGYPTGCQDCPYRGEDCNEMLDADALSLINRQKVDYEDLQEQFRHLDIECERLEKANESQKAEIERLQNDLAQTEDAYKTVHEMNGAYARKIDFAKAEAIKEFAERLKEKATQGGAFGYVDCYEIDNLVKEMVGDEQ